MTLILAGVLVGIAVIALISRTDLWQLTFGALIVSLALAAGSLPELSGYAYYVRVLLSAMLLVLALRTPRHGHPQRWSKRLLLGLWVCVAVGAASTLWSFDSVTTVSQAAFLSLLVANLQAATRRRWRNVDDVASDLRVAYWTMAAIVGVGATAALAGLGFAFGFDDRVRGLFDNANMLGYLSVLAAALGWALWLHYRRVGYPMAAVALLVVAIVSGSRTAVVAGLVGLVWALFASSVTTRVLTVWCVAMVGALAAALWSFRVVEPEPLAESVFARFSSDDRSNLNGRTDIWQLALDVGGETFFGVGFGASTNYLEQTGDLRALNIGLGSVHNSYLQWYLETGFVGVVPLVALLGIVTVASLRAHQSRLGRGLLIVVVVGLIVQVTESMIFGTGQIYPWVFWMAVAGLASLADRTDLEASRAKADPAAPPPLADAELYYPDSRGTSVSLCPGASRTNRRRLP